MTAAGRLTSLIRRGAALPAGAWPSRRASGRLERGWRAYLIETTSGQVGPLLDPVSGSWSIELNGIETGNVVVKKADLKLIDGRWYAPWAGSVLLTYTFEGVERPIVAGPITSWPAESERDLTLDFSGIRKVFERRYLRTESGTPADLKYDGLSLGSIGWRIVLAGMAKPGGQLPIVHGSLDETLSPGHQRTYEHWNLANNEVSKRLTELSEVINGPDFMFRPEWANVNRTALRWSFVHGTSIDPTIAQRTTPDWDSTAARSNVVSLSVRSSAEHLTTRVWGTGAGTAAGTLVTNADDMTFVVEGGPFLETIFSDTDQTKKPVLTDKARGLLRKSGDMVDQVSMKVRADDPKAPLGTWFVGDEANVTLSGLMAIPDGTRSMRIIKLSGGLNEQISIDFLEDTWE